MKEDPIFEFIPVEVMIKEHQQDYYRSPGESDALCESTPFLEFYIQTIYQALQHYEKTIRPMALAASLRLHFIQETIATTCFYCKQYRSMHKDLSTATASRDLLFGLEKGILEKKGKKIRHSIDL